MAAGSCIDHEEQGELVNFPCSFKRNFLAQTAQLGATSLALWLLYTVMLGPLWGWHLYGMGGWIIERAQFLREHGHTPHPILEHYRHLNLSEVWLGGSLYGALFLAWPMAIWMALGETLCRNSRGWLAWALRFLWAVGLTLGLGENILVFSNRLSWQILAFAVALICSWMVGLAIQKLSLACKSKTKANIKAKGIQRIQQSLPFIFAFLLLTPIIFHPVWSIWLTPDRIDAKVKIKPLIRDMLLLNEQGESWINSWYYNAAPLVNEKERITSFQPMVVGYLGLDQSQWHPKLAFDFQSESNSQGQRIVFIELNKLDNFELWLQKGLLDYVAIDSSFVESFLPQLARYPKGSVGFYSNSLWSKADSELYCDPNHYFRVNLSEQSRTTPITRQRDALRQQGYVPAQSACLLKNALRMNRIFNNPWSLLSLVVLMLWGLAWMVYVFLQLIFCRSTWWELVFIFGLIPMYSGLPAAYNYWFHPKEIPTYWSNLIDLHLKAVRISPKDLNSTLAEPLSDDLRLAMLQVSILGRSYSQPACSEVLRTKIVERFESIFTNYHNHPLNFRYKVIDATANIPALQSALETCVKKEKQMYVRWYGAEHGLGLRN